MITDEINAHHFLKEASTASPIPLEKQARDLSEKVFFDVQTLLQRSHHEAEENLHAFQALANAEITHMEGMLSSLEEKNNVLSCESNALQSSLMHLKSEKMGLQSQIERQYADILTLQENVSRIQAHQRHMQATHEAETTLLKDTLQRYKEKEDNLHQVIQSEKTEKMKLLEENISLQSQLDQLRLQMQQTLQQKEWEFQQKLQIEKQEKVRLQEEKLVLEEHRAKLGEEIFALEHDKARIGEEKLTLEKHKAILLEEKLALEKHKAILIEEKSVLERHKTALLEEKLALENNAAQQAAMISDLTQGIESIRAREKEQRDAHALLEAQYKNKLTSLHKAHLDEKASIVTQLAQRTTEQTSAFETRIQKLEALITLERENAKNKHMSVQKQLEQALANYGAVQKERQVLIEQLQRLEKTSAVDREKDLAARDNNAAAVARIKALEKEVSVIAQKKLTVEMNMKQLHQELIECKRIISTLRKKNALV